jgi:DNA uptake protein ComE-like DNA-binding protein
MKDDNEFENGEDSEEEPKTKIKYEPPKYLETLSLDIRQRMLNLHIWASRERFLKKTRQSMKNFIASLKHTLKDRGYEFTKIYLIEEQIEKIDALINDVEKEINRNLKSFPIWEQFLKNVKGIGPGHAGAIISLIGKADRFHSISALRKYSGWYVEDGKPARKKAKTQGGYSPKMKQYLFWFAEATIKAKHYYYEIYLKAKRDELKNHPEWEGLKAEKGKKIDGIPMHIHRRAMRKMIQLFLSDLFCVWRDIEGFPPTTPYPIAILGHEGFIDPLKENPYYKREESQIPDENQASNASHYLSENHRRGASQ